MATGLEPVHGVEGFGIAKVSPEYRKTSKIYYPIRKTESWYLEGQICVKWLDLQQHIIII